MPAAITAKRRTNWIGPSIGPVSPMSGLPRRPKLDNESGLVAYGPEHRNGHLGEFYPGAFPTLPSQWSAQPIFAAPAPSGRAEGTSRDNRASARYQRE